MKSKLRLVEVRKDKLIELPDDGIPLRLESVVESTGLVNPRRNSCPTVLKKSPEISNSDGVL